jgi:Fur family ferric uptake transcriptional regulator
MIITMADIKYTNQRVEILNFLKNNYSHPTVDQVFEGVKKKLTRISKATVYQNLRFLADKGLIQEVNVKGVSRFEPCIEPHHHLICKNCGKIIDFKSQELTDYSLKLANKLKEMKIESTITNFFGLCENCVNKK